MCFGLIQTSLWQEIKQGHIDSISRYSAHLGKALYQVLQGLKRVLLNRTWVRSKDNLLTPGGGEGKCSVYCRAEQGVQVI